MGGVNQRFKERQAIKDAARTSKDIDELIRQSQRKCRSELNVLVLGAPQSGKWSFLNALSNIIGATTDPRVREAQWSIFANLTLGHQHSPLFSQLPKEIMKYLLELICMTKKPYPWEPRECTVNRGYNIIRFLMPPRNIPVKKTFKFLEVDHVLFFAPEPKTVTECRDIRFLLEDTLQLADARGSNVFLVVTRTSQQSQNSEDVQRIKATATQCAIFELELGHPDRCEKLLQEVEREILRSFISCLMLV